MLEEDLKNLINKVKTYKAEFQNIEIKKAEKGCPEKLYDTLSSFSNQDDGGIIIFGIDESSNSEITGVFDIQELQKKVMEQCNAMIPQVRAVFTVAEYEDKYLLSAEIPPIDINERPCFYSGKGRIKGSYVRVGDADIPMTEYEVYSFEAYRKKYQDDIRMVERSTINTLNFTLLNEYLTKLKENKPNLAGIENEQIFELMNITRGNVPTLSSTLMFSIYPQAYFPQLCITAISVPGNQIGDIDIDGARFIDNKRIEGTIIEMLDGAIQFVKNNIRTRTIIDDEGRRIDKSDYPIKAVREILLNALVHRDYSIHTEGMPIQLILYANRLEVINPGGLYGRITLDTLGKIQPDTRNPVLATMLEVMKITENRYSGIPTVRTEMKRANLPEPVFTNVHGEFKVCLFRLTEETVLNDNGEKNILNFCKTPRNRKEIAKYLGLSSVTYAMQKYVKPLIDSGDIIISNKNAPNSSKQTYKSKLN